MRYPHNVDLYGSVGAGLCNSISILLFDIKQTCPPPLRSQGRSIEERKKIVGWVEPRNPTHSTINCADVGFRLAQPNLQMDFGFFSIR
jgi:hypothetical protein